MVFGEGCDGAADIKTFISLEGCEKTFMFGPVDDTGRRQGFSLKNWSSIPGSITQ